MFGLTRSKVMVAGCVAVALGLTGCGDDSGEDSATAADSSELVKALPDWSTGTPPARAAAFGEADNSEKVRIAYLSLSKANTYYASTTEAVEEAAKARNADVTTFDATFDSGKQLSQMQDAVTSGQFDAIIVIADGGTTLVPAIAQAEAKGIPVISAGVSPIGPDFDVRGPQVPGVVATAELDVAGMADAWGKVVVDACEGIDPCEVVAGMASAGSAYENWAFERAKGITASHPNIEWVGTAVHGFTIDGGRKIAQDLLAAHPDVDVMFMNGDQPGQGALVVLEQQGKAEDVKIIGGGGSREGIELTRDGKFFATGPTLGYDAGLYAVDLAVRASRDQPIENNTIDPNIEAGLPLFVTGDELRETYTEFGGQWSIG